jgi:hypothetical protein
MRTALNAQLIKPRYNNTEKNTKSKENGIQKMYFRMACVPSSPPYSHRRCMDMISKKLADVTLLEVRMFVELNVTKLSRLAIM